MKTRLLVERATSIVLLTLCVSSLAMAQGVGAIGGTVLDTSDAVLPGATVTLSNPGVIGGNQETVTDQRGTYQFIRLVPGRYSVRADLAGFRSAIQENVVVNADGTARVDLTLELGQLEEAIVVTAQAPLLDTTTALQQTVFKREVMDTLPGTNDLWSVARFVPGAVMNKYDVGGSESFQQAKISVHGSNPNGESQYQVDGMNIDAPVGATGNVTMYYDPFMFEEINYKTSNSSAETARGGIVYNMVTKTGTNTLHGAFIFSGSNQHLQSNNVTPQLRRDLLAAVPAVALAANPNIEPGAKILDIVDAGGSLSGPIVRDKLWYVATGKFVNLNQLRVGSYNPDGTQFVDDNDMKTASGKFSWAATSSSQLHFSHVYNDKRRHHYAGNTFIDFYESRATRSQTLETHLDQVRWTSALSQRLLLDVSSSFARTLHDNPPQKDVQRGDIARFDSVTRTHGTALPSYSTSHYLRAVAQARLNYLFGNHDLAVGYQFDHGRSQDDSWSMSHYPSGLRAVYRNGVPDSVNVYNTPTHSDVRAQETGLFIQDKWTPTRKLTLSMGLRVEKFSGWLPESCQEETIFIPGQCFAGVKDVPNYLDVAPRFALIYDVFGDGKMAVKVGANRYLLGESTGYAARINPIRTTSDTRAWTDRNGDGMPQLDELGPSTGFNLGTTNRYNPEIKRPYSAEYSVEVERQLFTDLVVSVAYYHRRIHRNIGSTNLAVPLHSYIPLQVTEASSGRAVTAYNQDPALRGQFDTLWDNFSELDSKFNGVDVTVNKRFSNRWMLMGGLSLGKNVGDIYGTADLNNPNFTFRRGVIGNDVPVSFKAAGSYEWPYGILLAGAVQHYTGFPENTTVLVSRNTVALTQVSQSIVVEPRGTTRLPDVNIVDLNVRKIFRIDEGFRVEPVIELFNLFNSNAIVSRTTQLGPGYGRVADILRGRILKFGLHVNF